MTTFRSRPEHYARNLQDGRDVRVSAAVIQSPDESEVPGVAIISGHYPRLIIPAEAGLRLAHQLADTLDEINALDTEGATR